MVNYQKLSGNSATTIMPSLQGFSIFRNTIHLFNGVNINVIALSGAENFLESQVEKTVTLENSTLVFNCAHFLREAGAGGGLLRGKVANRGMGRC